MVRKHYYDFRYLTNMLKIRSRGKKVHNTLMIIKFSKQIADSFAKISNGWRILEAIRVKSKTLSNI